MTFSLVARCARTGQFGMAIASSSPAVAARCVHLRPGVGAVASQNITDPTLGPLILDRLETGLSAAQALASVREVEKRAKKLTLMALTERTCKWPIGDPATDDFWFCGLPSVAGKPYCEAHVGVAFQPMSARRDRRR